MVRGVLLIHLEKLNKNHKEKKILETITYKANSFFIRAGKY